MSANADLGIANTAGGILRWCRIIQHDVDALPPLAIPAAIIVGLRNRHLRVPASEQNAATKSAARMLGIRPEEVADAVVAATACGWFTLNGSGDLELSQPERYRRLTR